MVAIALFCSCGARLEQQVHPSVEQFLRRAWDKVHAGPGHEPLAGGAANAIDQALEELRALIAEATGRPA